MRIDFLKHTDSDRLILIFAGWSTQPGLYTASGREDWDLAVVSGYADLDFDFSVIERYPTIYLYAWSLGVEAANKIFGMCPDCISAAFAINGTPTPVEDHKGIPQAIFEGTLNTLNERNLRKFRRRMAGSAEALAVLESTLSAPDDIEALKSELLAVLHRGAGPKFRFDRVFISEEDAIFPAGNQRNAWNDELGNDAICELSGPHLPDFKNIINLTIPDPKIIGSRFREALSTYDSEAEAQKRISTRLTELTVEAGLSRPERILEIGAGSGCFTRRYSPLIKPLEADYIDLYECGPFGCAPKEEYIVADAEKWLHGISSDSFDAILSASAIQWFVNPAQFFADAAKALKPGGKLICSSFTTGNLAELDKLRPSPIIYRTTEQYRRWLAANFKEFTIEEEEIPLRFNDLRSLLLHMRHTGVSGSRSYGLTLAKIRSLLKKNPDGCYTITYRPIYITAIK